MLKQQQDSLNTHYKNQPPSGGCVLKQIPHEQIPEGESQPPSGGCVLKHLIPVILLMIIGSRLQAAVC